VSLPAWDYYFWTVAAFGSLFATRALWSVTAIRLLSPGRPCEVPPPAVTVVVAVRDEQARIEVTIRGLLAQEGVDVRVAAVDDRSADRTGDILRAVAATDPRLSVVRVDHLPAGWLGKCHALHVGAAHADTEWLLFVDADTGLTPDVVARAVRRAEEDKADHLTLVPGPRAATLVGRRTARPGGHAGRRRRPAVDRPLAGPTGGSRQPGLRGRPPRGGGVQPGAGVGLPCDRRPRPAADGRGR
jgi:cellulose synthase/poly-beta-1,6-N-acetylglucosamine synthase-like glycosyltransferase